MLDESLDCPSCGRTDFGLTDFEREVIKLVIWAYSNEEIAISLRLSESDVGAYVGDICDKLSVANELELALFALYHQLVDFREAALT
jgi:DNA-binding NarL/FixJ family response regulator